MTTTMTTADQVLARARSALGRTTLYWLDEGGLDPHAALPSAKLAIAQAWQSLPDDKRREVQPAATALGIDVHDPALRLDACDCSGFVCWALGFSRKAPAPAPYTTADGWIFTGSIWADATGPGARFQRIDRARPGALVVYPAQDSGEDYGHVAIVVEADAAGRATLIAHCSKANMLSAPYDAIKITPPDAFERQPRSVYAWCRTVG